MTIHEKYRPRKIDDFVGLEKVKKLLNGYASRGGGSALLFFGKTGTGKSEMARALAEQMSANLQVVGHSDANKKGLAHLTADPGLFESPAGKRQLVVIDHVDLLSHEKQVALRPWVEGRLAPNGTIWVLIAEDPSKVEDGLSSRCMQVQFSTYGNATAASAYLERIWDNEVADTKAPRPNFDRIVKEANGSLRAAINRLDSFISGT